MSSESKKLLTTREVAERLNCSVWTVRRLARSGQLRAIRFGKGRRYREADLESFLRLKIERVR